MARPYIPKLISQGFSAEQAINDNFKAISDAFETTLNKEDDTANVMQEDLDMDGFRITNATIVINPDTIQIDNLSQYYDTNNLTSILQEIGSRLATLEGDCDCTGGGGSGGGLAEPDPLGNIPWGPNGDNVLGEAYWQDDGRGYFVFEDDVWQLVNAQTGSNIQALVTKGDWPLGARPSALKITMSNGIDRGNAGYSYAVDTYIYDTEGNELGFIQPAFNNYGETLTVVIPLAFQGFDIGSMEFDTYLYNRGPLIHEVLLVL